MTEILEQFFCVFMNRDGQLIGGMKKTLRKDLSSSKTAIKFAPSDINQSRFGHSRIENQERDALPSAAHQIVSPLWKTEVDQVHILQSAGTTKYHDKRYKCPTIIKLYTSRRGTPVLATEKKRRQHVSVTSNLVISTTLKM